MSSSEEGASCCSTTSVAGYCRRRHAATQSPEGKEIWNLNGIGQDDKMERLIASQNCFAAASKCKDCRLQFSWSNFNCRKPEPHEASFVVDMVILPPTVIEQDGFLFLSSYLYCLLTKIFLLPNITFFACLLDKPIY